MSPAKTQSPIELPASKVPQVSEARRLWLPHLSSKDFKWLLRGVRLPTEPKE